MQWPSTETMVGKCLWKDVYNMNSHVGLPHIGSWANVTNSAPGERNMQNWIYSTHSRAWVQHVSYTIHLTCQHYLSSLNFNCHLVKVVALLVTNSNSPVQWWQLCHYCGKCNATIFSATNASHWTLHSEHNSFHTFLATSVLIGNYVDKKVAEYAGSKDAQQKRRKEVLD